MSEMMQKRMLYSIEEFTGKKPDEIIVIIRGKNLHKHGEKIKFVKTEFGLSHGFANLLAHLSKEETVKQTTDPIDSLFSGKEKLRPLYEEIMQPLKGWEGLEVAPKKSYVSLRTKKQFSIIQPSTKSRLDIGLNLKGIETSLAPAGSWNTMVTHRIKIEKLEDFNPSVIEHLKIAYDISTR